MRTGFVVLAAGLTLGCVGGDSSGPVPGALGGPCLSNGSCNAGLTCELVGGMGQCEPPDATVDAPVDQSSDGPAADAASDAPADAADAACNQILAPKAACPNADCTPDAGYTGCCAKIGQCGAAVASCGGDVHFWACQQTSDCPKLGFPSTDYCCTTLSGLSFTTCPPSAQLDPNVGSSSCASMCTTGQVTLCANALDCPSPQTCVGVQVGGLSGAIGVCR